MMIFSVLYYIILKYAIYFNINNKYFISIIISAKYSIIIKFSFIECFFFFFFFFFFHTIIFNKFINIIYHYKIIKIDIRMKILDYFLCFKY